MSPIQQIKEGLNACFVAQPKQKLANKLLSPEMAKIVSKGNKVAYLSYLGTAACLGLGAWAAVKVKDMIVNKKS